jgi:hypothetical protein
MTTDDHVGPVLQTVRPDDHDALRALFAEQRARLAVVRRERIWEWFAGPESRHDTLVPLYGKIAFMALVPVTLVVAGFTQGPVTWLLAALCCLAWLPELLLVVPFRRRLLRRYRRAVHVPAVVLAAEPEASDPANQELRSIQVLCDPGVDSPGRLQQLLAQGDRIAAMVAGAAATEPPLAAFVTSVRVDAAARHGDGSHAAAPAGLPATARYARLRVSCNFLPGERLTSRLLFVFVDVDDPGPRSAGVLQPSLWGEGAASLCAAFPWPVRA